MTQRHAVAKKSCVAHTAKGHRIPATFSPCDMSREAQQVGLCATYRRHRIAQKFELHELKIIRTHKGTSCSDMSW